MRENMGYTHGMAIKMITENDTTPTQERVETRGRPKNPPHLQATEKLQIRCTKEEIRLFKERAAQQDKSVTAFVKDRCIRNSLYRRKPR